MNVLMVSEAKEHCTSLSVRSEGANWEENDESLGD
jgi:hypothetical protein